MLAKIIYVKIMDRKLLTCGQLERNLSQRIHKLYREELGNSPHKITTKLFDNHLAIVIENALTALQKTLIDNDNIIKTAQYQDLNSAIDSVIKLKLKTIIEEVLEIEVSEVMFNSAAKTQLAGAIVILSQPPLVRQARTRKAIAIKSQHKKDIDRNNGSQAESNSASITKFKQEDRDKLVETNFELIDS